MKNRIFDTTVRDGAQNPGISLTDDDRLRIIDALAGLGIDCIETGFFLPGSEEAFTSRALELPCRELLSAFAQTRRPNSRASEDPALSALVKSDIGRVTIFGKCSVWHASTVLRTTPEENLGMIADSTDFLVSHGKRVVFDAEHFFDGYGDNPDYALKAVAAAVDNGAEAAVLCDTNGGMLPDVIGMTVAAVKSAFPTLAVGILFHYDIGMADAASVSAVLSGAEIVSGTVSGIGERCGNANLNTLIPLLQLKLGFGCIPPENMAKLTRAARKINELANREFDEREPFVGSFAFTHKAGTHIDAVTKAPRAFEHVSPESVGNRRSLVVSGLCGRAAILSKLPKGYDRLEKDDPEIIGALEAVKELEAAGYSYEDAEASLALLIDEKLGRRRRFFEIVRFQATITEGTSAKESGEPSCAVLIKVKVGESYELAAAEGNGPVNALDLALRKALLRFYPELGRMTLTDYKVRVLSGASATASLVRVLIQTSDGEAVWRTVGVSADIVEASRIALCDAIEYRLGEICKEENPDK